MKINCIKCNKNFLNKKILENHNLKFPYCNIANYICKICNFKTNIKSNYNYHIKSKIHLENENKNQQLILSNDNFICKKCNHIFRDQYHLNRHINRKIPCIDTNQTIINNSNITNNNITNNNQIINNNNILYVNVNNPNALIKNLNSLDSAYLDNLNLSYSIDDEESLERFREIINNDPEKQIEFITIDPDDTEESIKNKLEINKKIVSNIIAKLISQSFLDNNYPKFLPLFKNPKVNDSELKVKSEGQLKDLNIQIINKLLNNVSDIKKIQQIIKNDENDPELNYILEKLNKDYELLRKHYDKKTLEYKNSEKISIKKYNNNKLLISTL